MKKFIEIKRDFEICKKKISTERDRLRDLLTEMQCIEDSLDKASDDLVIAHDAVDRAADSLSEYL